MTKFSHAGLSVWGVLAIRSNSVSGGSLPMTVFGGTELVQNYYPPENISDQFCSATALGCASILGAVASLTPFRYNAIYGDRNEKRPKLRRSNLDGTPFRTSEPGHGPARFSAIDPAWSSALKKCAQEPASR